MIDLISRLRERRTDDSGFSLLEMLVVMALLSIVMTVALTLLTSLANNEQKQTARSDAQAELSAALETLSRDLRESNPVYAPPSAGAKLSQASIAIGPSAGPQQFIRWEIVSGQLVRQTLDSADGDPVGATTQLQSALNLSTNTAVFQWYREDGSILTDLDVPESVSCAARVHITLQSGALGATDPITVEGEVAIRNSDSNRGASC